MAQQPDATVDQTTPEVDPQKQYLMDQWRSYGTSWRRLWETIARRINPSS